MAYPYFGEYFGITSSGGTWTDAEKKQIRYRLGIDGTATVPSTADSGLGLVEKWILNKLVKVDNGDGTETWTLYDNDGTTVLKTWVYTTATTTRAAAT